MALLLTAAPASADCTIAEIEICTLNDPTAAERLLLDAIGDGTDPVALYRLGRHYWMAPTIFRDPVRAVWYIQRAADLGYATAIEALAMINAPAPAQTASRPHNNIPSDPPSVLTGVQIGIADLIRLAYDAGFHTEGQLLAVLAIAIAESSLWTAARNWKPELGYRPASDTIGVPGPPEAWQGERQMHSDRGLWQISSWAWPDYSDQVADDPGRAARAIFEISDQGRDFSLWASFLRGTAQSHYDREFDGWPGLRPIVQAFLEAEARSPSDAPVVAATP